MSEDTKTISVNFFTKDPALKNPSVENTFNVPITLTRFGLSEIVNHLLGNEKPTPFDFLIDGIFLRSNLENFLDKQNLSHERVVSIEYVEAQPAPKEVKSIPHDDWINSVSVVNKRISSQEQNPQETDQQYVVTGCFDGLCRVIDMESFEIKSMAKHPTAVKKVATVSSSFSNDNPVITVLTSCKDEFGRVWKYDENKEHMKLDSFLSGHESTVQTIESNPTGSLAVTGSWDNNIKIWDTSGNDQASKSKRRRLNKDADDDSDDVSHQEAIGTLQGHQSVVSALAFGKAPNILYSASWDHSIRLWDIYAGISVSKMNGSKVTSELSVVQSDDTVLSGHTDFAVRLWDPRVENKVARVFRSHAGIVRSVQWCESHPYQFVTAGDDSRMKLWDIRSSVPIHTLFYAVDAAVAPHVPARLQKKDKQHVSVLCSRWSTRRSEYPARSLVTGDSNCQLRIHRIPSSVTE
eukprot:gb/GECH01007040.1/.p1 GENE.gb/GECH01007040.1/~~gb/GECH01007040.1/.p1  ORF type:complete len:464 (+),score=94.45 gb/GECH01007040.1/:1-1392(+)